MKTLVECVANFSEGRDLKVLDAIVTAIRSVDAVHVWISRWMSTITDLW